MDIPLSYNLRNLVARRTTTIMTALGIALTVAVLLSIFALVEGLRSALTSTGHPLNVMVTRKGSTAELNSTVTQETFQILKVKMTVTMNPMTKTMQMYSIRKKILKTKMNHRNLHHQYHLSHIHL